MYDDAGKQFLKLARPLSHRTQGQNMPCGETPHSDKNSGISMMKASAKELRRRSAKLWVERTIHPALRQIQLTQFSSYHAPSLGLIGVRGQNPIFLENKFGFFWFLVQNWSQRRDLGYSSYHTKYQPTIFYGDPFQAPGHFLIFKKTFLP